MFSFLCLIKNLKKLAFPVEIIGIFFSSLFNCLFSVIVSLSKLMYEEGDLTAGIIACGQGVGLIDDIPMVKELIERVMKEAEESVKMLSNL